MIRWFVEHPVSVFLLIILIGLIGVLSVLNIPLEIRPEVREQTIRIVAYWGKQSPETMQRVVTSPLEEIASQIREVASIRSTSGIGLTEILLKFPPRTELKYAYIELREKIARLRRNIPREVYISVEPYSEDDETNAMMRMPFFSLELSGDMQIDKIRKIADEKVIPLLKSLDGIAGIDVFGGAERYLLIDLDENKLRASGLNLPSVRNNIRKWLVRKGLGSILVSNSRQSLIFNTLPSSMDQLLNIPIRRGMTLGDIGSVELNQDTPVSLFRHNYKSLVTIDIYKGSGINSLRFSGEIKSALKHIRRQIPEDIEISVVRDSSEDLLRELNNLLVRSLLILGVVFLLLFIMMKRLIMSVIILSTIFLSILSSAILLYLTGYTINVVTLAGIALVFGMLVDNAVVILDNIYRRERLGDDIRLSAIQGTKEMIQPLIASTGTTIFVFFALLLLQDRLGNYYKPLAFSLGFALLSSLFLAITLIPAVYAKSGAIYKPVNLRTTGADRALSLPLKWYGKIISAGVNHPVLTLLIFGLMLFASYRLFSERVDKGGFINWYGKEKLNIYISAPRGITLEQLDEIAAGFERRVKALNVPCDVRTSVDTRSASGRIHITFPDSIRYSLKPYLMKQQLIVEATNYAGVGIYISGFGLPYYNGGYRISTYYNTVLSVTGPRYEKLQEICKSILKIARKDRRVGGSLIVPAERNLYYAGFKNLELSLPVKRIWESGISLNEFSLALEPFITRRFPAGNLRLANAKYDLVISTQRKKNRLHALLQKEIPFPNDIRYKIGDILDVKLKSISPWIDRENQQYRFCVAWEYRGPERLRSKHEKKVVEQLSLPPGYKLIQKRWGFLTKKEEKSLINLLMLVILGTFMILASLYESFGKPFIIFLSVPLSLIGIFLAYVLFNREFNVNSYIGLILLSGMVVNNAIILVDRIRHLVNSGMQLKEALIKGAQDRIRPILITTFTTIGGLLAILFLPERESILSGIMKELSFITVSGIISSTVLSITFIPVIYYVMERLRYGWKRESC